ncbi:MAG: TatD family hydrolase [Chloroflexi bacterium]|nr:TatD family hydrolase [Chloroflexota bacterium]
MHRLIDTHAHLEEIQNLDEAIAGAKAAGLVTVVAVGSDYESDQKVLQLAQVYRGFVHPALGLHPWNLKDTDVNRTLELIEALIGEVVGVGEIGLDYDKRVRARTDKDTQQEVLRRLLHIAQQHDKPALIHSRYAWQDALDLVKAAGVRKAIFHWYTGTSGVLREIIAQGYFISATPAVEYHEEHRRAVREVPLGQLLLETDSPVVYQRGTEAQFEARPADVARVLKALAALRGITEEQIAEATTENSRRLFGLRTV